MRVPTAWYYAWLVKHYGGVPLITEPFDLDDDFNVPRASYDEAVQWITGEIDEAIELLPVQQSSSELGRADQLGNEAAAREFVNMIRARPSVNMPPITESGPALLERIRHERQIELVFEAKRFFDILRWQTAEVVMNEPAMGVVIHRDPDTGVKTYEYQVVRPRTFHPHMYLMPT